MRGKKCKICVSPLRDEIEFLASKKVSYIDIVRKYYLAYKTNEQAFYPVVVRHIKRKHAPTIDLTPITTQEVAKDENGNPTFHDFAKSLLEKSYKNLDNTKISPNHVIQAQKVLIEERKVDGQLDQRERMLRMFFRGTKPKKAIIGEVLEDYGQSQLPRGESIETDSD